MSIILSMIILAGGCSSRMGTDKSELVFQNKTFLDIQIQKGVELGIRDILVSGYRGAGCRERVVMDRYEKMGPMGGMEACLRQAAGERCLVVSVDTPLLSVLELQRLIAEDGRNHFRATILQHGLKEEPLMGVYDSGLADDMAEELERDSRAVFTLLNRIGYGVYHSRGEEIQFKNINDIDDYRSLLVEQPRFCPHICSSGIR